MGGHLIDLAGPAAFDSGVNDLDRMQSELCGAALRAVVADGPGHVGDAAMARDLQEFVKRTIAPYKYPRAIEFTADLPRTETGKIQRFRLRQRELAKAPQRP
jgi:2-aminobenzoate-CoA ligase